MMSDLDKIAHIVDATGSADRGPDLAVWAGNPVKLRHRHRVYLRHDGRLWLAKVARSTDAGLLNERRALQELTSRTAGTELAQSLPKTKDADERILLQEWVSGETLIELAIRAKRRPWRRAALQWSAMHAVDWLVKFHQLTAEQLDGDSRGHPWGGLHGDFKPSNVIVHRGRGGSLTVIDWELFERSAAQLVDLFHFLTYLGLTCAGLNSLHGFRTAFVERTWVAEMVRRLFARYLARRPASVPDRLRAYQEYLTFILKRRVELGLTNQGYFLQAIQEYVQGLRQLPFAFGPPESDS